MTCFLRNCVLPMLVVFLAGCSTAPNRPESIARGDYARVMEYISGLVRSEMEKHDVTGLSIALVDDQHVMWARGFGYGDKNNKVAATPDTIYRVGSISKLFTATATMQLVEQGRLDIDKPLQTYLPDFSIRRRFPDTAPVTPRALMTHHSGLPSDLFNGMWSRNPEPFGNLVEQLGEEYAVLPPNTVFSYSNLGVTLLGHAVEKITGERFASRMDASLLHPLGMTRSSFSIGPDQSPLASKAYRTGREAEEPSLRDVPAGGLNSSVLDLSRFIQMVFAGGKAGDRQIVKDDTLAEMLRSQNTDIPLDLDFRTGLGWALGGLGDIDIRNAGPVAHHAGGTIYHRSMLIILPEHKLGVVALSNSSGAGSVVSKVASEALKLTLEAKTGIRQPERNKSSADAGALSPEALQSFEGRYDTIAGVVSVRRESDHLLAEVMNTPVRLVPRGDGLLALRYKLLGLFSISLGELDRIGIAAATVAGHDILKANAGGRELLVGSRIRPVPISDKWLERTGEYDIVNAGEDVVLPEKLGLRHDNGLLLVEYAMPVLFKGVMSLALAPISDTEAVIVGLGRGKGETMRVVAADGKEHLKFSGYLLRKKLDQRGG